MSERPNTHIGDGAPNQPIRGCNLRRLTGIRSPNRAEDGENQSGTICQLKLRYRAEKMIEEIAQTNRHALHCG